MTLDAIKARRDAATPGPWRGRDDGEKAGNTVTIYGPGPAQWVAHVTNRELWNNADFIAHSRTDIERLIAVAEAAERFWVAIPSSYHGTFGPELQVALDALDQDE